MGEKTSGPNFRAAIESVIDAFRQVGDSAAEALKPASVLSEEGLRSAVLVALKEGGKTGHEVAAFIEQSNGWGIRPTAAKIYPILERLLDESLVSLKVTKGRKVYSLTEDGVAAAEVEETPSTAPKAGFTGPRGELTEASRRLAKVAFDVSLHGSPEQQAAAAEAIDEARRKLHEILSEK